MLSFMGNEFAQFIEWDFSKELDWCLLAYDRHRQMREWVKALNRMYLTEPSFYENDSGWDGFRWLRADDRSTGVIAAERMSQTGRRIVCILNLCPVERKEWADRHTGGVYPRSAALRCGKKVRRRGKPSKTDKDRAGSL